MFEYHGWAVVRESTGRILGRFDLAVAVFFALSGFLLWRGHAAAARGLRSRPSTGHYLRSRIVRIMPGSTTRDRMPSGAISSARPSIQPSSANLVA